MDTLKVTVRFAVLGFVFVAAAITFAGLNPSSKAEIGTITTETVTKQGTNLSSSDSKDSLRSDLNATG